MMSEIYELEKTVSLTDWDVWIIDNDIPIFRAEFADDDMKNGERPIDRGTLLYLLSLEDWDDIRLRDLCEQLIYNVRRVTAFIHPGSAVLHLERGAPIPDVVVFDWEYGKALIGPNPLELLERMLGQCVSVVQVYTKEDADEVARLLGRLLDKYQTRLEYPRGKAQTDAKQLMGVMVDRLNRSLSARLASRIRRLSSTAVENVLVKIDDLPLNVAVRLMVGKTEEPPSDTELVELLSVKVGDAVKSAPDLTEAVGRYATAKGVPSDRVPRFVEEMVDLLAANVRERIQYEGWLYEAIRLAWENVDPDRNDGDDDRIEKTVREFFAFRLYDQPGDGLVRTGDIVLWSSGEVPSQDDLPDLYLVLTPPCDLARFWKRTRGVLTLARIHPTTQEKGMKRLGCYGNPKKLRDHIGGSITARQNPVWLPSVPITQDKRGDYVLFVYEIDHLECDSSGSVQTHFTRPLTYERLEELGVKLERKCRVSEPFLGGIMAELRNQLFRSGVPDFPDEEKKRLKGLFDW